MTRLIAGALLIRDFSDSNPSVYDLMLARKTQIIKAGVRVRGVSDYCPLTFMNKGQKRAANPPPSAPVRHIC